MAVNKVTSNQINFERIISTIQGAELGNLFGKPCGKINKKAFVAFYEDEMVFKIGQEEVNLIKQKYEGAKNWDPSGKKRPMKDWIQIPSEYHEDWEVLTQQAVAFYEANL